MPKAFRRHKSYLLSFFKILFSTFLVKKVFNSRDSWIGLLELLLHPAQKDQTNQKNPEKHPNNPLRCMYHREGIGGTTVVYSRAQPPDPYLIMAPHNNNKDGRILY